MDKIRVFIIDDSAVVRQTLTDLLNSDRSIEVIGSAQDPVFASKKLDEVKPDVIILDIEMPRMDGLTFLRTVMKNYSIPVIICSSKAEEGSENALQALEYGAVEIVRKPKLGTKQFLEESKVRISDAVKAAHLSRDKTNRKPASPAPEAPVTKKLSADVMIAKPSTKQSIETTGKVIVVGASTGGTEALKTFLEQLPLDSPGVVIVQHMPEHFTAAFAKRMDSSCRISVKEAENSDSVLTGRALIAPGNKHILLKRSGARYYVEIKEGPLVSRHRPSVDVLFRSAARYAGKNTIGIIMTGMGDDGARGMEELKEAGAYTIAQDEATSIVFGMPREAIKRNAVDIVLPLTAIAEAAIAGSK
ncbi:MAG: chemotaxis response regulator protein-glutamate methylesterase [Spirochaetia bacterium]